MLPLLHFCVSAANIRKIIFVYQSQRTVAYLMQIMRPATDIAYELRFYDVPATYLFFIIYKVMKYRKILMKYIVYFIFSFYIFTPPECTYNVFGLPLTFPLTYCSALQNFKRL